MNTTHDWASTVDSAHLESIRREPETMAPGGVRHLILEVVAYAADEAECTEGARCVVTLHADGSVSVSDNGRGTDTRTDEQGRHVKKPIMASKDLRFFDSPDAQDLPDGHPRRGMSVVAALSRWLVHTNRRQHGAWTQRYEYGVPVTDLLPVTPNGTTGTTVHFRPDRDLLEMVEPTVRELTQLTSPWRRLSVEIVAAQGH
ncbi:ATP-binding protein [Nocardia abscessus]|uniref:ATP-binding protein n=1 Tax=Nocardia abscessus TaxID=120957 RepID=UPI00245667D8|nr:ATP-binding protein [Nocardia abscessus]